MSNEKIKGKWDQIKGEIRKKWGAISNDEIESLEGDVEGLIGLVVERYGIVKEEAEKQVKKFFDDQNERVEGSWKNSSQEIMEKLESFKDSFSKNVGEAKENISEVSDKVAEYVKQKPLTSILISFFAGAILAIFNRRDR